MKSCAAFPEPKRDIVLLRFPSRFLEMTPVYDIWGNALALPKTTCTVQSGNKKQHEQRARQGFRLTAVQEEGPCERTMRSLCSSRSTKRVRCHGTLFSTVITL